MQTVNPTEHIDMSCELAAAVVVSWLIHFLHLLPLVSINVIPMTFGYYCSITLSPSEIDELFIDSTHAVADQ